MSSDLTKFSLNDFAEVDLGLLHIKMEPFAIIVNGLKLLTIIIKCFILDVARVPDPPLDYEIQLVGVIVIPHLTLVIR